MFFSVRSFALLALVASVCACSASVDTSNLNCPFSQAIGMIFDSYNPGQYLNALSQYGIFCNDTAMINQDNAMLCTGNLPFNGTMFISFSGTQFKGLSDLLADINTSPFYSNDVDMVVMRGFYDKFQQWKSVVNHWVGDCYNQTIIVGGHSLGGAIAHIMGLYLSLRKHCSVKIVTAGEPGALFQPYSQVVSRVPHLRFVTYSSMQSRIRTTTHYTDIIVDAVKNFGYFHGESVELPLYKRQQYRKKISYQNAVVRAHKFGSIDLHLGCEYIDLTSRTICKNNGTATFKGW